jgi:hypothetical protein
VIPGLDAMLVQELFLVLGTARAMLAAEKHEVVQVTLQLVIDEVIEALKRRNDAVMAERAAKRSAS